MGKFTQQAIANVPAELRLQVLKNTSTALKALNFSTALAALMVQKGIVTEQEVEDAHVIVSQREEYKESWDTINEGINTLQKQVEMNRIVEKIITEGIESLTEEERKIYEETDDVEGKDLLNGLSGLSSFFGEF